MKRLLLVVMSLCALVVSAQERSSDTLEVYFHQGSSAWDAHYRENGKRLDSFVNRIRSMREDTIMRRITKIQIVAGCSPEGLWDFNQRLSKNRAKRIREVLNNYIELPDSVIVERAIGINWPALRQMVAADERVPYQSEVLDIIDNSPELTMRNGRQMELRKLLLMWGHDGASWRYMYRNFYPTLRSFTLNIIVEWDKLPEESQTTENEQISQSGGGILTLAEPLGVPALAAPELKLPPIAPLPIDSPQPFYMALKSNLLYDALLIPNIGAEFYLGRNWSVTGNWAYAWWSDDSASWYWRAYGGELGVRKWLGKAARQKPLTGHHVGLYGQVLTYDFVTGNWGYMGGEPGGDLFDRANYVVALEYGYSLPIGRRLNLDFVIGVGYHWGRFYEYKSIDDCYVWQATKNRNFIGPTKAELSLVWLIGKGNYNKEKGGRR